MSNQQPPKTLFEAVRFGTEADFNLLLKKGLGIAARDEQVIFLWFLSAIIHLCLILFLLLLFLLLLFQGRTVLHIAAEEGKTSFLKFLLKLARLDINSADNYGMTPLHRAIRKERLRECELLISFKADPYATTRFV